ncbi:MAG TPA: aldose 1-epimerase family protein, partial [Flavisolibacter sp.]|nr:aldose 1-epimerase family protein [Flavisolibacter sp.]
AFWGKISPVLFPIVGTLKNNRYRHQGIEYQLPRHGFAREKQFDLTEKSETSVTFSLQSTAETLEVYPFAFGFSINYSVEEDKLSVQYRVKNRGAGPMFFSVGGHPAFKLPLADGTAYNDYTLRFEKEETAPRWPISNDGLIEKEGFPFLDSTNELPLSKDLFKTDAVVLKNLKSKRVALFSAKTPHGLDFFFDGFSYLGLWAASGADFLCIEPWCGIADSVDADGELESKEGIVALPEGDEFTATWTGKFY